MTDFHARDLADERLDDRLRADAAAWRTAEVDALGDRVRTAVASLPPRRRPTRLVASLAALVLAGATWWAWPARPAAAPAAPAPATPVSLAPAIEPLERELVALSDDAHAVVARVWDGVRRPVRRWLGE